MANAAPSSISEDEIKAIMGTPKFMANDLSWSERPAKSTFLIATDILLSDDGSTIPGLTVDLHYRRGVIMEDCLYRFTLFSLKGNNKRRVYQIEVVPDEKKSHNDKGGSWFGPHQHFGERAAKFDPKMPWGCGDYQAWFDLFLSNANIQFSGKFFPPETNIFLSI